MTQKLIRLRAAIPPTQMQHPPRQRLSSNGVFGNYANWLPCLAELAPTIPVISDNDLVTIH